LERNPDEELIHRGAEGDEFACQALYEKYRDRIYLYARRMLNDAEEAADVVQEVFEYFFRKLRGYRFEAKTQTLLYTAARSRCLNRIERGRKHSAVPLEGLSEPVDGVGRDPAEEVSQRDQERHAVKALDLLSDNHREVIVLKIMKGLSYDDISEVLGIPSGTVKSRLHGALEALRKKMK
jgi:RNA polymerase sigma-70 factor (ECF subfamily)